MKTRFLLPHKYKIIGMIILVPSIPLFIANSFFDFEFRWLNQTVFSILNPGTDIDIKGNFVWVENNLTNEIAMIFLTLGCILTGFSKEKDEDEYISQIRLDSLVWATYINYLLLTILIILFYGSPFLIIVNLNMFSILILFLIRFNYTRFKNSKYIA